MRPLAALWVLTFVLSSSAGAQTSIRGRVLVLVDTSGSMVWHFNDCASAGGDGSTSAAAFCDNGINGSTFHCADNTTCSPAAGAALFKANANNPSRLLAAKAALNDVVNSASGSVDFGLERYAIATAADFRVGTPTICADPNNCCVTPAGNSTTTKGRCVPQVFSAYPNVPGSVSCVGTIASPCNLTYVGGCGANGMGGQMLVTPADGSSSAILPWVDFVEDFCSTTNNAGGAPRNPELRGAGNTPLAGSVRTAIAWYEGVYKASKLVAPSPFPVPSPSPSPLPEAADPLIDCRPYVFVVMTDGGEMCENPSAAVQAVAALSSLNPNNPVKTYVLGMAFAEDEQCASTSADAVSCPMALPCKTVGARSLCGCDPAQNNPDGTNAACGTTCERFAYLCGADGVCHHPALDTLSAMATAGGTLKPRFANSQADIEAVFADIVASTVLVERCNNKDDDCNGQCDEPFPDVAVTNQACSNQRVAKACDNGQPAGTHCFATGAFVCSADHLSEVCGAPGCADDSTLCPVVESCNGEDDDCNGVVDDCVPFVAGSCCTVTCPACNPLGVPMAETCNGCDDDCDGIVDNHLVDPQVGVVGGAPCTPLPVGQTKPPCDPGKTACVAGQVVCQGEVLPKPNQCGMSTDCTGVMSTGNCPEGTTCLQGNCLLPCMMTEFPCPGGFTCQQSTMLCVPDPCIKMSCPADQTCQLDGEGKATCVDACTLLNCPSGYVCTAGQCVDNTCRVHPCPTGQLCTGDPPACAADPCATVTCPAGQFCGAGGACQKACVPGCLSTQMCSNGTCTDSKCKGVTCPAGQVCAVASGAAACVTQGTCPSDACAAVRCPQGTTCVVEATCAASCQGSREDRISPAGGGGFTCETSSGGPARLPALLAVVLLMALSRRRARLWLLVAALAGIAGCKANSYCLNCGPNGERLDLATAPIDLAGADQTGAGGDGGLCVPSNNGVEVCDHVDNDCNGSVDDVAAAQLVGDPNNCGACFHRCDFTTTHQLGACIGGLDGTAPRCQAAGCIPGFIDLNGDPADGCEYACTPSGAEVCDGVDNDCNGLVDDNPAAPTNLACADKGVCAGQTIPIKCEGLSGWRCDYTAVPNVDVDGSGNLLALETRCDGLDNNCNGVADKDGFPALGTPCTAGLGVCVNSGTTICGAGGTTVGCSASPTPARATDELCNGLDDDCNGLVDEPDDYVDPVSMKLYHGWHDAMVKLPGGVFIYAYEASRPDASGASQGGNASRACSKPAVLPWADVTQTQAQAACAAVRDGTGAPMRLCTAAEWQKACEGPAPAPAEWSFSSAPTVYAAGVCNDINRSPSPAPWATGTVGPNGSKRCFVRWTPAPSPSPIYDLSGNLKEWTATGVVSNGTTYYQLRGGAFDSLPNGATCELAFDIAQPGFVDNDVGFRCCADHAPCGDTQSDPNNCGFCGDVCGGGTPVCLNGACAAACGGLTNCSNACVDLTQDPAHCGACGTACLAGQVCTASACVCAGTTTLCGGRCVQTSDDPLNCGGCGIACMGGQVCNGGACAPDCGALANCGGSCVNEQTDHDNCGGCAMSCAPSEVCASGGCCGSPLSVCSGQCVDEQSDDNHCGNCSTICAMGVDHCSAGKCCSAGFENCTGGSCTDTLTDNANCGACGNACAAGSTCCGGLCVDETTDSAHCGGCSIVCGAGQTCLSPSPGPGTSSCCPAGQNNCGGTCSDPQADDKNCGGCGIICSSGSCLSGKCGGCPAGQSFCSGKCIVTSINPNNCGGCGNSPTAGAHICSAGTPVCWASRCDSGCPAPLTNCGGSCLDTKTDGNNCGGCGTSCTGCVNGGCGNPFFPNPAPSPLPCGSEPGPVLGFTTGGGPSTCSGNLAATSFTWAICACNDVNAGGSQSYDAYNSVVPSPGPFTNGGSVGVNGSFNSSSTVSISGDLWALQSIAAHNATINQQVHYTVTENVKSAAGGFFTPVPSPEPCLRCDPNLQIPIAGYVTNYAKAVNNNDAAIGLSPSALSIGAAARLDLPCGIYYLSSVASGMNLTVRGHGNTALFINGNVNLSNFAIDVDPIARLDLFVNGNLTVAGSTLGNPAYPTQIRIYVTGNITLGKVITGADIYTLAASTFSTQSQSVEYGSLFVGFDANGGNLQVHFDLANAGEAAQCTNPAGTGCTTCLDCGNQACNAGTCGSCSTDSDCCAPLRCVGGNCQFTSF